MTLQQKNLMNYMRPSKTIFQIFLIQVCYNNSQLIIYVNLGKSMYMYRRSNLRNRLRNHLRYNLVGCH